MCRERMYKRRQMMKSDEILIKMSAIDERTLIILEQQKQMKSDISELKSKSSVCSLHQRLENRVQNLQIADAEIIGEMNTLDLKTKVMVGVGIVFLSSIVSVITSKLAMMTF